MKRKYTTPEIEVIMMDAGEIALPVASDSKTADPGGANAKENLLFGDEDILPDIMPKLGVGTKPIPQTEE